jgi:hypothetical protein
MGEQRLSLPRWSAGNSVEVTVIEARPGIVYPDTCLSLVYPDFEEAEVTGRQP